MKGYLFLLFFGLVGVVATALSVFGFGGQQYIWVPFVAFGIISLGLVAYQVGTTRDGARISSAVGSMFGGSSVCLVVAALFDYEQSPKELLAIAALFLVCAVVGFIAANIKYEQSQS